MRAGEICVRQVATIDARASVVDAAKEMREQHVGDLVVVDRDGGREVPMGVVTDRDVVLCVVAQGLDPARLEVSEVMERELVTALETEEVSDVLRRMRKHAVRRVPVVDAAGALIGIFSLHDALLETCDELVDIAAVARDQLRREYARRR
jgi:CBS domain-containing protein